jgi:hypothetical protein
MAGVAGEGGEEEAVRNLPIQTDVYPLESPAVYVASVPRQFGVGVMMILMTVFAMLFAFMSWLTDSPEVFAVVAVMFLGVTVGQILLFQGKKPRAASALVGAVLFPLTLIVIGLIESRAEPAILPGIVMGAVCSSAIVGAPFGYGAGAVMAGIFLVMDWWSRRPISAPLPDIELQPFTVADIDTLVGWIRSPLLQARWAGATFPFPLDRAQVEAHLEIAAADKGPPPSGPSEPTEAPQEPARAASSGPARLFLKAVLRDTQCMVGYVELGINQQSQSAVVELPLVGPAEPERAALTVALLRAVVTLAIGQMDLRHLEAHVSELNPEGLGCYRRAGFRTTTLLPSPGVKDRGYYVLWDLTLQRKQPA